MNEIKPKSPRQPPWEVGGESESGAFGIWLRREREARDVSLSEIADVTKISKSHLEALEQERFDLLPAPVFAKGFLREYAKYVGLDPDAVVNSYLSAVSEAEPESAVSERASPSRKSFEWTSGILLAVALILLLAAVGFLGFWAERSQAPAPATVPGESSVPAPAAAVVSEPPVPAPAASVPDEPEPVPTAPLMVTIDFTEDCWVEAAVDGRRRLSELHIQGESLLIAAQSRVELTLGNPGGVEVEVNGKAYPLREYVRGSVARDIVIAIEEGE
jgi:cytoskeletal protein RodZ